MCANNSRASARLVSTDCGIKREKLFLIHGFPPTPTPKRGRLAQRQLSRAERRAAAGVLPALIKGRN